MANVNIERRRCATAEPCVPGVDPWSLRSGEDTRCSTAFAAVLSAKFADPCQTKLLVELSSNVWTQNTHIVPDLPPSVALQMPAGPVPYYRNGIENYLKWTRDQPGDYESRDWPANQWETQGGVVPTGNRFFIGPNARYDLRDNTDARYYLSVAEPLTVFGATDCDGAVIARVVFKLEQWFLWEKLLVGAVEPVDEWLPRRDIYLVMSTSAGALTGQLTLDQALWFTPALQQSPDLSPFEDSNLQLPTLSITAGDDLYDWCANRFPEFEFVADPMIWNANSGLPQYGAKVWAHPVAELEWDPVTKRWSGPLYEDENIRLELRDATAGYLPQRCDIDWCGDLIINDEPLPLEPLEASPGFFKTPAVWKSHGNCELQTDLPGEQADWPPWLYTMPRSFTIELAQDVVISCNAGFGRIVTGTVPAGSYLLDSYTCTGECGNAPFPSSFINTFRFWGQQAKFYLAGGRPCDHYWPDNSRFAENGWFVGAGPTYHYSPWPCGIAGATAADRGGTTLIWEWLLHLPANLNDASLYLLNNGNCSQLWQLSLGQPPVPDLLAGEPVTLVRFPAAGFVSGPNQVTLTLDQW